MLGSARYALLGATRVDWCLVAVEDQIAVRAFLDSRDHAVELLQLRIEAARGSGDLVEFADHDAKLLPVEDGVVVLVDIPEEWKCLPVRSS